VAPAGLANRYGGIKKINLNQKSNLVIYIKDTILNLLIDLLCCVDESLCTAFTRNIMESHVACCPLEKFACNWTHSRTAVSENKMTILCDRTNSIDMDNVDMFKALF